MENVNTTEKGLKTENEPEKSKKMSKWLGVEIMMAMYFMVMAPSYTLMQQFMYSAIAEEKNYTITDDSQGYCGPDEENLTSQDELRVSQIICHFYIIFNITL